MNNFLLIDTVASDEHYLRVLAGNDEFNRTIINLNHVHSIERKNFTINKDNNSVVVREIVFYCSDFDNHYACFVNEGDRNYFYNNLIKKLGIADEMTLRDKNLLANIDG